MSLSRHYLEFLINDNILPYNMTVFQAIRQYSLVRDYIHINTATDKGFFNVFRTRKIQRKMLCHWESLSCGLRPTPYSKNYTLYQGLSLLLCVMCCSYRPVPSLSGAGSSRVLSSSLPSSPTLGPSPGMHQHCKVDLSNVTIER